MKKHPPRPAQWLIRLTLTLLLSTSAVARAGEIPSALTRLAPLIGSRDALVVADHRNALLFSKNGQQQRIPASTLKLLTALVALEYLGPGHRFTTEFYMDHHRNLVMKGYGDPLLVSEVLREAAQSLARQLEGIAVNDLVMDDTFFKSPIDIPGISLTTEPYDAPNGALCANFNTVNFNTVNNALVSAEPQTPLLPFARKRIRQAGLKNGRIVLSHGNNDITLYTGRLLGYFLEEQGVTIHGNVRTGTVTKEKDRLVLAFHSPFSLDHLLSQLLEYSNNFTANQLLIAAGAKVSGSPGTLAKGVAVARTYAQTRLGITDITLVEGSGISRKNRISALNLLKILDAFEPHHALMRKNGREYYKTGTLEGIATRVGYIQSHTGTWYRYVLMINTPDKFPRPVMRRLRRILK